MKCPKCGHEMENGHLQWGCEDTITWVTKLLPFGLGYWKMDAEIIPSTSGLAVNAVPACICKRCKVLLCDYGQGQQESK